jgi:hypothetical protein
MLEEFPMVLVEFLVYHPCRKVAHLMGECILDPL